MADHARDAQAHAFRDAGPDDLVTDEQIAAMIEAGQLEVTTDHPTLTREQLDAQRWDAGREGPKDIHTARAALADRVDDPAAPDDDASAYDDLT